MEQIELSMLDDLDVYHLICEGTLSFDEFNEWLTFFEESIEVSKFE